MLEALSLGFKTKRAELLREVSCCLHPGEVLGLLGPNGSGKSTLMRLLSGFFSPTTGRVELDGKTITSWTPGERAQKMAWMPAEYPAEIPFSVREIISMGRRANEPTAEETATRDATEQDTLQRLGLTPFLEENLDILSSGERQKTFLAMTLAQNTPVILLDEPTSHLDIGGQRRVLGLLREQATQQKKSILLALQDPAQARGYCDTVLTLKKGHRFSYGKPQEALTNPLLQELYDCEF